MAFEGAGDLGRADVEVRAPTGAFKADVAEIRRVWQQTTGALSDGALRAAVAQEKLDRAIARHGPESLQAKTATVAYRREMQALEAEQERVVRSSGRLGGGFRTAERDLGRFGRGALVGTGLLHGLGRAAAFASTTFIGGAGLVYALRQTLQETKEQQVALAQARNAVEAAGLSWGDYKDRIAAATDAIQRHTGFEDDQVLTVFGRLVRKTGDVGQAFRIVGIAANFARANNLELEKSAQILIRAQNGQTRGLAQYGFQIPKVTAAVDRLRASGEKYTVQQLREAQAADKQATAQATLGEVQRRTAGSAAAYLKTAAGAQDEFNVTLKNSEQIIGGALAPTLTKLLQEGSAYLDQLNRSGELQRDVNSALHSAKQVVDGLRAAYNDLEPPISATVQALGGLKRTIELLALLSAANKLRAFGASFGFVRRQSALTAVQVERDAAAETAAMGRLGSLRAAPKVTLLITAAFAYPWLKGFFEKHLGADFSTITPDVNTPGPNPYAQGTVLSDLFKTGAAGKRPGRRLGTAAERQALTEGREAAGNWPGQAYYRNGRWYDPRTDIILNSAGQAIAQRAWDETHGNAPRDGSVVSTNQRGAAYVPPTPAAAAQTARATRPSTLQTLSERISSARLGIQRGTPGAKQDLVAALRDQIDYDRRYEKVQEGLIRRGVGDRKKHVEILERLRSEEGGALDEIAQLLAPDAGEKTGKGRGRGTAGRPGHVAAGDTRVGQLGASAYKTVAGRAERVRQDRQALVSSLGGPSIDRQIQEAKIQVRAAEGHDTSGEELRLLQLELRDENRRFAVAKRTFKTGKQRKEAELAYWQERAQLQQRIHDLKQTTASAEGAGAALAREFVSEYQNIVGTYAPNVTGGTGPGRANITVIQQFPHPPTTDGHREATYAKHAMGALFQ